MGKLFFFALGVGATVFVVVKGRELARKATPQAVQESFAKKVSGLVDQASQFLSNVQEGSAQREAELRDELGIHDRDAHSA